jgi:hypothetical protein
MDDKISGDILLFDKHNKYNGNYKYLTNNCPSCRFDVVVEGQERCYWGVAWKKLVPKDKLHECQYHNTSSPRESRYNCKNNTVEISDIVKSSGNVQTPLRMPSGEMDAIGRWDRYEDL